MGTYVHTYIYSAINGPVLDIDVGTLRLEFKISIWLESGFGGFGISLIISSSRTTRKDGLPQRLWSTRILASLKSDLVALPYQLVPCHVLTIESNYVNNDNGNREV